MPPETAPTTSAFDLAFGTPPGDVERLSAHRYAAAVLALQQSGHAGETMAEAINRQRRNLALEAAALAVAKLPVLQHQQPDPELLAAARRLRAALEEAEGALRVHEANLAQYGDNLPDGWDHRAARDVAGAADLAAITLRRTALPVLL